MSPSQPQQQLRHKCFPRVSGDEPYWPTGGQDYATFSLRERG